VVLNEKLSQNLPVIGSSGFFFQEFLENQCAQVSISFATLASEQRENQPVFW
jgi:hypothetical protein